MKKILFTLIVSFTTLVFSQEKKFENDVKMISQEIENIIRIEKSELKTKVAQINKQLESNKLTLKEANELKKSAADYHAKKIEDLVEVQETKLQKLVQEKTNTRIKEVEHVKTDSIIDVSFSLDDMDVHIEIEGNKNESKKEKKKKQQRKNKTTTSQFVFALGVNNVLVDEKLSSLNNSNYKLWQSHFYELGWTWKTLLAKETGKVYVKYGVSFLWNYLRTTDNQYHEVNGDETILKVASKELSESKLRQVQMIFPLHLELDFSKNKKNIDRTHESVRLGVGGFAGFNLGVKQYLEYKNDQGLEVREKQKGDFNTGVLTYGLSSYLAWESFGLYAKYDLNPLFVDTEVRSVSFGARFDFN